MPGQESEPRSVVGAVIPAFHPDGGIVSACRSLLDQVDLVVVVDDGGGRECDPVARCRDLGVVVVRHEVNRGIAAALNSGIDVVRTRLGPLALVLTLDQDSSVPPEYVVSLLAAAHAAVRTGWRVAAVGPERVSGMRRSPVAGRSGDVVLGREPIQSGLLVTPAALDQLGGFDESLFIDGVDTEYYFRARAAGMVMVIAPGTTMEHRIGARHTVRLTASRTLTVAHSPAFRYYYIVRNQVLVARRFGRLSARWALSAAVHDVRHLTATLLVPGRAGRLSSAWAGLLDGMRGRTGPRVLPARTADRRR